MERNGHFAREAMNGRMKLAIGAPMQGSVRSGADNAARHKKTARADVRPRALGTTGNFLDASGLRDALADGEAHQVRARLDAELLHDALLVAVDGLRAA
jgi:hypothetical protein